MAKHPGFFWEPGHAWPKTLGVLLGTFGSKPRVSLQAWACWPRAQFVWNAAPLLVQRPGFLEGAGTFCQAHKVLFWCRGICCHRAGCLGLGRKLSKTQMFWVSGHVCQTLLEYVLFLQPYTTTCILFLGGSGRRGDGTRLRALKLLKRKGKPKSPGRASPQHGAIFLRHSGYFPEGEDKL